MYRLIDRGEKQSERRDYIRHPAEIPIQLSTIDGHEQHHEISQNLSSGGVSCTSDRYMAPGSPVEITIEISKPGYKVIGHIVWCLPSGDTYSLGIGFDNTDTAYTVRMIEQACQIECYRRHQKTNGRHLSADQAAHEWIKHHAANFPWIR